MLSRSRRVVPIAAGVLALFVSSADLARADAITGPSSSQSPYVVGSKPGVVTKSILTVGDSAGATPYRMVGIPDGLGAFDNGDGTLTVLMNHELGAAAGAVRAHGAKGAFVSRWTVRKGSLEVEQGEDLIQQISLWNAATGAYDAAAQGIALTRLCSADLPEPSAFWNAATGRGYPGRLFTNGEESGAEGRAFAHALDGTSYQLPALGRYSYENAVAHPDTGDRTVVVGLDDSAGGQVYVYAGDKTTSGNPAQRAGLDDGQPYGIRISGLASESDASTVADDTPFAAVALGDVRNRSGAQLESDTNTAGATRFQRPEDGAWDPTNPRVFYFVTTASFTGRSRLWRLTFDDPADPAAGGEVDLVLDGTEGQRMMDNLTVDRRGRVIVQEDPGGQDHLAKVFRYSPASDRLTEVAHHDPDRFAPGGSDFLTRDEESSGVIDVSRILGSGWYLADVQAHAAHADSELVEHGQLLAIHLPQGRRQGAR